MQNNSILIHFTCFSGKDAFIVRNRIRPDIISEGPGWIEIKDDGINYELSCYVYKVTK